MQYIVVKDMTVIEIIEWDGITPYEMKEGLTYEANDYAGIGWIFDSDTNKYINPSDGIYDESTAQPLSIEPDQKP